MSVPRKAWETKSGTTTVHLAVSRSPDRETPHDRRSPRRAEELRAANVVWSGDQATAERPAHCAGRNPSSRSGHPPTPCKTVELPLSFLQCGLNHRRRHRASAITRKVQNSNTPPDSSRNSQEFQRFRTSVGSIGVGRADWVRLPLPPNRACGSPAHGSVVSQVRRGIERNEAGLSQTEEALLRKEGVRPAIVLLSPCRCTMSSAYVPSRPHAERTRRWRASHRQGQPRTVLFPATALASVAACDSRWKVSLPPQISIDRVEPSNLRDDRYTFRRQQDLFHRGDAEDARREGTTCAAGGLATLRSSSKERDRIDPPRDLRVSLPPR